MKKDVFVNEHKWPNIVKDCKRFMNQMKELKLYLVKFNKDGIIKNKIYQLDYTIRGEDC